MMTRVRGILMITGFLTIACSRGPSPDSSMQPVGGEVAQAAARTRGACTEVDSTFAVAGPVYNGCAVDREARPVGQPRMDWSPPRDATREGCYRAIIHLVVDEQGKAVDGTARIARSTNTEFARAAMQMITNARFRPAMKNGAAVKQVYVHDQAAMLQVAVHGQRPPPPSRVPC